MADLLQTPCYEWHVSQGGRMVDFAGWQMPVQYSSIVAEHKAVRQGVGMFDISHMGRLWITGPDREDFVNRIITNDLRLLQPGQICYSLVTNEQGGILDDILVYRFPEKLLLVVNASNRAKILGWLEQHREQAQVQIEDRTATEAMFAIQGPAALGVLQEFCPAPLASLGYYRSVETTVLGYPTLVSRTGYTGEDGFEIILSTDKALKVWTALYRQAVPVGGMACGLGCRDTLRLEAAMPLYGHELTESIDPFMAGLAFAVKLDKPFFIGQSALRQVNWRGLTQKRVGLELPGRRIAREGANLYHGEKQVGVVTSGTFSPTLQRPIAMAYVLGTEASVGNDLAVDLRTAYERARVVPLPFYKRPKKS